MIPDFKAFQCDRFLIGVEKGGAVRTERRFGAGAYGEAENRDLLVAENLAVYNPLASTPSAANSSAVMAGREFFRTKSGS